MTTPPDAEILSIVNLTWKVRDPQSLADAHGMEVLRLTLLDLADTDPNDPRTRSPSGLFITRLHEVVARQRSGGAGAAAPPPIEIPDSDPLIDLAVLWETAIERMGLYQHQKASKFQAIGPDPILATPDFPDGYFPPAFVLIAASPAPTVAVIEVDYEFNVQVFFQLGGRIQRGVEDALSEIRGRKEAIDLRWILKERTA